MPNKDESTLIELSKETLDFIDQVYSEIEEGGTELEEGEFTTNMFVERTGLNKATASRKLKKLVDEGKLLAKSKIIGGKRRNAYRAP